MNLINTLIEVVIYGENVSLFRGGIMIRNIFMQIKPV